MDRARGTGAATRGGPGAGTAARGGPGAGREGGGVRDSPGARPRRSPRYRGAFTRPARWHGASARSRPAQRAGTPQQWSQRAGTPQPRPLRVEIRVALHPAESVATLRHRYRHSIRLSVQFVATDCMANRRRSVSSRLGHLYVSKERQGPGRPNRRRPMARGRTLRRTWGAYVCHVPHASAPMSAGRQHVKAQSSHGVPAHQAHAKRAHKKGPHHEDAGPPKPAASR